MVKVALVGCCQWAAADDYQTHGERMLALMVETIFEDLTESLADDDARVEVGFDFEEEQLGVRLHRHVDEILLANDARAGKLDFQLSEKLALHAGVFRGALDSGGRMTKEREPGGRRLRTLAVTRRAGFGEVTDKTAG